MSTHPERDPQTEAALRRLPAPEHRPGFWEELDHQISGRSPVPVDQSRPRSWWLAAAAAVVMVMVAAGIVALVDDPDGQRIRVGDDLTTTTGPPAGSSAAAPAQAAALEWLDLVAAGNMQAAWERLGPTAKQAWPSFDAFARARSGFAEGIGTWTTASNREVGTVSIELADGQPIHVVTITGVRRLEGTVEDSATAIMVREGRSGEHLVEPFFPAGSAGLRFTSPESRAQPPVIGASTPVSVTVPGSDAALVLVLERDGSMVMTPEEDGEASFSYLPNQGWTPGRHVVTAVLLDGTGAPMATAVVFDVA